MFLCGLCNMKPTFPGNRAPVKHPDLIAVSFLTTGSQRDTLKVQLPCLGRELPGEALGDPQPCSCRSQEGRAMKMPHCDEQE